MFAKEYLYIENNGIFPKINSSLNRLYCFCVFFMYFILLTITYKFLIYKSASYVYLPNT